MEQYCPHCGETQSVIETVAWQPDACGVCGNELEGE